jgi:nitrate reductase gamma subunit
MSFSLLLLGAFTIFLIGNIVRVVRTLRMPRPVRWELYPVPKGPRERQAYGGSYFEESEWWTKPQKTSRNGELRFLLKEVFTLHLVRKNFPALWPWSMTLHWGLYLYIVAFAGAIKLRLLHTAMFNGIILWEFRAACLLGAVGALGLIFLRCSHSRLRPFTTPGTLFPLYFLLAIFVSGIASAFANGSNLPSPIAAALSPTAAHFDAITTVHLILLACFVAYFPFTHLTHMYMKYFTWHRVRWDDDPAIQNPGHDRELSAELARPISWHASHIAGTGAQTWNDAVTQKAASEVRRA